MLKLKWLNRYEQKLYYLLFGLVALLLLIPWAYMDSSMLYTYLPRRSLYSLIGATALVLMLSQGIKRNTWIAAGIAIALFGVHYHLLGYLEPHYLFEIVYLEIATLIFFAPDSVKKTAVRIAPYVLYAFLLKAIFFRIGSFIHGGFYASNLYATYIIYLCMIEIHQRRWWNILPATLVMYFAGSKSVYIGLGFVYAYLILSWASQRFSVEMQRRRMPLLVSIVGSALFVFVSTSVYVRTAAYKDFLEYIEPFKDHATRLNMILYGLTGDGIESRRLIQKHNLERKRSFEDRELSLDAPMISDIPSSAGLRAYQYDFMYNNLDAFIFMGDVRGSQVEMIGHNPHSAILDFISRLGLLFLVAILFLYYRMFRRMDLILFNLVLFPILAFQPYGYTLGHSLPVLALAYALAVFKPDQKKE